MRKYLILVLFLSPVLIAGRAWSAENKVVVDMRKGLIGPLRMTDALSEIKKKLGERGVRPYTYEQEGSPQKGYELTFPGGAQCKLTWGAYEIESKAFHTTEGLGVGSTWKEFKAAYPEGQMDWMSDAYAVWSEKYKFRLYFPSSTKAPAASDKVQSFH